MDRLDAIEDAMFRRQHFTVPVADYEREVVGKPFEAHVKAHTTFQGAPTPEDEDEFLARHGASDLEQVEPGRHSPMGDTSERSRRAASQTELRRQAALQARRDDLRRAYQEKVEAGELRPRTDQEKLERTASGQEENASTQAARSVLKKRAARAAERYAEERVAQSRRAAEETPKLKEALDRHPALQVHLPGGWAAHARVQPEGHVFVTTSDDTGKTIGTESFETKDEAAASIAAQLHAFNFTDSFPAPLDIIPGRSNPYGEPHPTLADEKGLHHETQVSMVNDLHVQRIARGALTDGIDPRTHEPFPEGDKGKKARAAVQKDLDEAHDAYSATLSSYADAFGRQAATAFDAHVRRAARDEFEGRVEPEAAPPEARSDGEKSRDLIRVWIARAQALEAEAERRAGTPEADDAAAEAADLRERATREGEKLHSAAAEEPWGVSTAERAERDRIEQELASTGLSRTDIHGAGTAIARRTASGKILVVFRREGKTTATGRFDTAGEAGRVIAAVVHMPSTAEPEGEIAADQAGEAMPLSETMKLGHETVQQGLLGPGMERSAKQAAAARGPTLKPRVPQQEPGGLFGGPPDQTGELFEPGEPNPKFSLHRKGDQTPDLFAAMEPVHPRPEAGPFAEPAEDRGKVHFDQNHADLDRLGRAAQRKSATPAQLNAEAERLADEMGQYFDWTDWDLSNAERAAIDKTGRPTAAMMLKAARAYIHDLAENGAASMYDPELYHDVMNRWYRYAGGERPKFQTVFHGSPHDFDRFSMDHLGTGEGFQSFGHGLYFSSDRAVAEYYRNSLRSRPGVSFGGVRLEDLAPRAADAATAERLRPLAARLTSDLTGDEAAAARSFGWASLYEVLRRIDAGASNADEVRRYAKHQRDVAQQRAGTIAGTEARVRAHLAQRIADSDGLHFEGGGKVYEAQIPDDNEFLHRDLPLSQQPNRVQEALRRIGERIAVARHFGYSGRDAFAMPKDQVERLLRDVPPAELEHFGLGARAAEERGRRGFAEQNGTHFYDDLAHRFAEEGPATPGSVRRDASEASRVLNDHGVPGLKYTREGRSNYVVFDDNRISMTAKFAQRPFYSAVERMIDRSPQASATGDQWLRTITNAPGIKKEELDWMGLPDWLKMHDQEPVSKEAIQAFVRDHGVNVAEVVHGATPLNRESKYFGPMVARALREAERNGYDPLETLNNDGPAYRELTHDYPALHDDDEWAVHVLDDVAPGWRESPQYGEWTLPGGKNQHELLLTLPDVAKPPGTHWNTPGVVAHVRFNDRVTPDGKKVLFIEEVQSDWHQQGRDQGYAASPDPETVRQAEAAHVESRIAASDAAARLMTELKPAMERLHEQIGNEAMGLGETSDRRMVIAGRAADLYRSLHFLQTAREATPTEQAEYVLNQIAGAIRERILRDNPQLVHALGDYEKARLANIEATQRYTAAANPGGIPHAPFRSSWPSLVMKRVIRWAAENEYDHIAWTTGEQQAKRYNDSFHVYSLTARHAPPQAGAEGKIDVRLPENAASAVARHGRGEHLANYAKGYSSVRMTPAQIREVFGRELGERIIAAASPHDQHEAVMEGLDLRVGGEGQKQFYDRNLPNMTNDLIKKYGARVGKVRVNGTERGPRGAEPRPEDVVRLARARQRLDWLERVLGTVERETIGPPTPERLEARARAVTLRAERAEATREHEAALEAASAGEQHGFALTPDLKEAAQGGFPLFERRRMTGPGSPTEGMERLTKGLRGTEAEPSDLTRTVAAEIARIAPHAQSRAMARMVGFGPDVTEGHGVVGAQYRRGTRQVIAWSLESPDPIGTGRHEALHALRDAGLFSDKEWKALEKAAVDQDWLGRFNIGSRYANVGWEAQLEEAIADRFATWNRDGDGTGLSSIARTLFSRLKGVLAAVARVTRRALGADPTAEDVLHAIETGDVGRRAGAGQGSEERGARFAVDRRRSDRRRGGYTPVTEGGEPGGMSDTPGTWRPAGYEKEGLAGQLRKLTGAGMDAMGQKINARAAKIFGDDAVELNNAARMAANPMAQGTARAQAPSKEFANTLRENWWEHGRIDKFLVKNFSPTERRLMWEAGDQESVLRQRGLEPGPNEGLNRLTKTQRDVVEALQAQSPLELARKVGITEAEGLPSYVPRMVVRMTAGQPEIVSRASPKQAKRGANLFTTTGQMRQRKYETVEETEAAAKRAFGPGATVVRDIRTLALANARLNQAIAGRVLVNRIREIGARVGEETVTEGGTPDPSLYFTIPDHPALQVWRPAFATDPKTGKTVTVKNPDGTPKFEAKPIWISKEFEGPLKAVLSTPTNDLWKALMNIKGKTMGIIMYSPLMHNAVIWGKALPATGWKAFGPIYTEGNRAKNDPETMGEAIRAGVVPIGQNYHMTDVQDIAAEPGIVPGSSWVGRLFALVPKIYDRSPEAGQETMRVADKVADFWHNTLLWDRVGDLQMGIYTTMRDSLTRESNRLGISPEDAQKIAAHFANRYAGALPAEAMSKAARMIANTILFSRSFTLGNIGTYKDMIAGLPTDVQAQIGARGKDALHSAQGIARRKAASMFIADVTFMYVGLALAALAVYGIHQALGDRGWKLQLPWNNEPGKGDRVLVAYQPDGTGVYMRLPTGKVAEDLLNWGTHPVTTLENKLNPLPTGMAVNLLANELGGQRGKMEWQPDAPFPIGTFQNLGRVAWNSASRILPENQLQSAWALGTGQTDPGSGLLGTLGPIAGLTISHGAPGGPAMGDIFKEQDRVQFEQQQEIPALQQKWRDAQTALLRGDNATAMRMRAEVNQEYRKLGISGGLAAYYNRVALNPKLRMSRTKMQSFMQSATPAEKAQFEQDYQHGDEAVAASQGASQ